MKRIGIILLILIIIIFNFIIGANERGLRILPIGILMSFIFIYLIIKKIKEPDKSIFFKSKIDYLVLIFMATTMLPLIFKTYCSYSDTVEFIIKYFFIYSVYILARNVITDKKDINNIITATLICSLIPIILGLDDIYFKKLSWIMEKLSLVYVRDKYSYISFSSTFGYANAVAIYMSLCLFLAIYKIKNSENKIVKIISILYSLFITYIIWITSSKAIVALVAIILLIYFVINNREKISEKRKIVILGILSLGIIGAITIICLSGISESVFIKKVEYDHRFKYNFKPNTVYTLKLDLQANTSANELKNMAFELQIIQANKYFKESKIAEKRFGNVNGEISIEFAPEDEYTYIRLRFLNDFHGSITINKCYINDEEYIIKYKYLPQEIGKIFVEYNFNQKSVKERMYIYKECLEIAKGHLIIGQGGNTWKVLAPTYQEYRALLKETHSYFFELLISYGIIGVLAFLVLVIALFVKLFKQIKNNKDVRKEKILIFIGVFLVLIHSIAFDFSMSFMIIQIMVYIYMAALLYDEHNNEKIPKAVDYIILLFLAFVLSIYIRNDVEKYMIKYGYTEQNILSYSKEYCYNSILEEKDNKENKIKTLEDIQKLINKEPYYNQTEVNEIYFKLICDNIGDLSDEEIEKYLNFGIDKLKTVKFSTPLFIDSILKRTRIIKNTITKLEEYEITLEDNQKVKEVISKAIEELGEVIDSEYENNMYYIEAKDRTGYSQKDIDSIKEQYLNLINKNNI